MVCIVFFKSADSHGATDFAVAPPPAGAGLKSFGPAAAYAALVFALLLRNGRQLVNRPALCPHLADTVAAPGP